MLLLVLCKFEQFRERDAEPMGFSQQSGYFIRDHRFALLQN